MRRSCAAGRWALAWKLLAPATLCPLPVGTRHMNLKFLETFVWVARLKSFRLTAEKLFSRLPFPAGSPCWRTNSA